MELLKEVLKFNDELKIQKFLEENSVLLRLVLKVPDWAFNYVLPQFQLGSKYRVDFIVVTGQSNSYEVTIVELKRPEANLYNRDGTLSKEFNMACTQVDNYRRWIDKNPDEFKRSLSEKIRQQDSTFEENFEWTRRFRIYSTVIIGRSSNLSQDQLEKNDEMEDKGVRVISYDRLIKVERWAVQKTCEGLDLSNLYGSHLINHKYYNEVSKIDSDEYEGSDNVLFLGDEEREFGYYGFYKDIMKRESDNET